MWYKANSCPQILLPLTSQVAPLSALPLSHWWYSALAVASIAKCMYVTWGEGEGLAKWVRMNVFLPSQ